MMYFAHQHQYTHEGVAQPHHHRYPVAPQAIGNLQQPQVQAYVAPPATLVQYGPTDSAGYFPQPVFVKRHNPYAAPRPKSLGEEMTREYAPVMPEHQYDACSNKFNSNHSHQPITTEELLLHQGALVDLSRTAPGSSFIQAALKDGSPFTLQNSMIIASELLPAASTLLLDAHGCYVVKTLMERLPAEQLVSFVRSVTADQQLVYSMCTHSLHTRRVVQYLMDIDDVAPVAEVLIQRCVEISTTQQGCIIMQRAMDITPEPLKAQLFSTIFDHILEFAVDPFANYVVQHMLEIGDKDLCSSAVLRAFRGNIVRLACNKFASNVMEKSLFHITAEAQHDLLHEMYDVDEEVLLAMLQDSFGNYFIQSSIALASFKDVSYINDRLRRVLQRSPYGHKIELRLERRLKGRPVGTRSSQIGANSKTSRQHRGRDDQVEEPW